jgi:hypothetical protein
VNVRSLVERQYTAEDVRPHVYIRSMPRVSESSSDWRSTKSRDLDFSSSPINEGGGP